MEILVLVVLLGLIPAAIAKSKGRSFFLWWIYGMAIWIIAFPHSLLARTNRRALDRRAERDGMKKCGACAEMIRDEANFCRYCGYQQPA